MGKLDPKTMKDWEIAQAAEADLVATAGADRERAQRTADLLVALADGGGARGAGAHAARRGNAAAVAQRCRH